MQSFTFIFSSSISISANALFACIPKKLNHSLKLAFFSYTIAFPLSSLQSVNVSFVSRSKLVHEMYKLWANIYCGGV